MSRALLGALVERNAPAYYASDAGREDAAYRSTAARARAHLAHVNGEPDCATAKHEAGYRSALADLARGRPTFQPCVREARLARVRCSANVLQRT